MELKQIKELMAAMVKMGIKRIRIKDKYELELEAKDSEKTEDASFFSSASLEHRTASLPPPLFTPSQGNGSKPTQELIEGKFITSPLVGTIYYAPSPEDAPFVRIGDKVNEHSVVCIIEAMKVMNEVKAKVDGTIVELLVENGHPVEFGTKLFRIG